MGGAHDPRARLQRGDDLLQVEERLWIWSRDTGLQIYDFAFERYFACSRPFELSDPVERVARVGAVDDYQRSFAALLDQSIRLVHTPEQHLLASRLPRWYPLLEDLTPRSMWFDGRPDPQEAGGALGWPLFMKGTRQTSRHQRALSIIEDAAQFERALDAYADDPILAWQDVTCRALAPLRPVEDPAPKRIPSSYEFRTFWWHGQLVGCGRYWWQGAPYELTDEERPSALAVAQEAARRVLVPFLVVDVAQRTDGQWIVIECNDGQESGYAGIPPFALWQAVLRSETERRQGGAVET